MHNLATARTELGSAKAEVSASSVITALLQLLRPGNVVTSMADVLAGVAIAGTLDHRNWPLLLLATCCLYAGGIVWNDFFDRHLDQVERPERPIPSARIRATHAFALGAVLLCGGVAAAFGVSIQSGIFALLISLAILIYNTRAKHHWIAGPVFMGTCRGLNLLLGVSLSVSALRDYGYVALLPTIYIAAVTVMGRSEVHGGKPTSVAASTLLITGVAIFLVVLSVTHHYSGLIFVIGLLIFVLPAFIRTYQEPLPLNFRSSVKNGVLGLVVLEGAIAASFAGFLFGLGVVMLLVPAKLLARRFAVT